LDREQRLQTISQEFNTIEFVLLFFKSFLSFRHRDSVERFLDHGGKATEQAKQKMRRGDHLFPSVYSQEHEL